MRPHHEHPHRVALAEAVAKAGSQKKLADAIGRSQRNVWDWLHVTKAIPPAAATRIELATGVDRRRLCPNFEWNLFGDTPPHEGEMA